jgi:hypothetical protein
MQDISDIAVYQLNYGLEYLRLGKVMLVSAKSKYADGKSSAYLLWYLAENKEVPDRRSLILRLISTVAFFVCTYTHVKL